MFSNTKSAFFAVIGFILAVVVEPLAAAYSKLQIGRTDSVLMARLKMLALFPLTLLVVAPLVLVFTAIVRLSGFIVGALRAVWGVLALAHEAWNHKPMTKEQAALLDFFEYVARLDARSYRGL